MTARPGPAQRLVRVLAATILAVAIALCLASAVFLIRAWDTPSLPKQFGPKGFSIAFALAAAGTGWAT